MGKLIGAVAKAKEESKKEFIKTKVRAKYEYEQACIEIPNMIIEEARQLAYDIVMEFYNQIKEIINDIIDTLVAIFEIYGKSVIDFIKSCIEMFMNGIKTAKQIKKIIFNYLEKKVKYYIRYAKDFVNGVVSEVESFVNMVKNTYESIKTSVENAIKTLETYRAYLLVYPDIKILLSTITPSIKIYEQIKDKLPAAIKPVIMSFMSAYLLSLLNFKNKQKYGKIINADIIKDNNTNSNNITNNVNSFEEKEKLFNCSCLTDYSQESAESFESIEDSFTCSIEKPEINSLEDLNSIILASDYILYTDNFKCDIEENKRIKKDDIIGFDGNDVVTSPITGTIYKIDNNKIFLTDVEDNLYTEDIEMLCELYKQKNENIDNIKNYLFKISTLLGFYEKKNNKAELKIKNVYNNFNKSFTNFADILNNDIKKITGADNIETTENEDLYLNYTNTVNTYKNNVIALSKNYISNFSNIQDINTQYKINYIKDILKDLPSEKNKLEDSLSIALNNILKENDYNIYHKNIIFEKLLKENIPINIVNKILEENDLSILSKYIKNEKNLNEIKSLLENYNIVDIKYTAKPEIETIYKNLIQYKLIDEQIEKLQEKTKSSSWSNFNIDKINNIQYYASHYINIKYDVNNSYINAIFDDKEDIENSQMNNIKYWRKYLRQATLFGLNPAYWSTGFILLGIPIRMPVIYIPFFVLKTNYGVIVMGISICGLIIQPMSLFVNLSSSPEPIIKIPAIDIIKKQINDIKLELNNLQNINNDIDNIKPDINNISNQNIETDTGNEKIDNITSNENDITIPTINTNAIQQIKEKLAYAEQSLSMLSDMLYAIPIGVLMPNSMTFGMTIKKPILTNQIAADIDSNINLTLLSEILDKIKIPPIAFVTQQINFEESILNKNLILKLVENSLILLTLIEPIPKYSKLSLINLKFLLYLNFFCLEGAGVNGITGYPMITA